ncbi:MAG: WYL domain-containing protein [Actinomycetota bacterium]|nr:WYL domain-containing protein [Actinomycetota bacterium]
MAEAFRGALILLKTLSERPSSPARLMEALLDGDVRRDERTLRRWISALRNEGFDIEHENGKYKLLKSPVRLDFTGYETLVALSVLESLAAREPVYGQHFDSAAAKLRDALPEESLKFADAGRLEFDLDFASDPPESPEVMETLRRATHRHQRLEILYHSLNSDSLRHRTVEPIRVSYAQRAHRLFAYEPDENGIREFRINRIKESKILPDKFSPETHIQSLEPVELRLTRNAFIAYGDYLVPDAGIELTPEGGAILTGTTPSTFWTVRDLASLGPDVEVLGGPKLKSEYLSFLEDSLKKHR